MYTIELQVQDSIYDHIIFLLKSLNTKELKIIEDSVHDEVRAFSNHSANIIEEWQDDSEDDIWK